jgi:hypothetical protein
MIAHIVQGLASKYGEIPKPDLDRVLDKYLEVAMSK